MNEDLEKNIVCPKCKNRFQSYGNELFCSFCNNKYFSREGILDMFVASKDKNYDQISDANILYHNIHANVYMEATDSGNHKRTQAIFERFQNKKNGIILDIGCGIGGDLGIAKNYFNKVFGIDCSIEMLKLAKNSFSNIIRAEVGYIPLRSNYFDFINCFSVLHHCYGQKSLFKEAFRLLKNGGVFYSDNDSNSDFYKIFKWWIFLRRKFLRKKEKYLDKKTKALENEAEYHQKNGLGPEKLKNELKNIGFKEVEIIYHYPDNPDTFTKIIKFANKVIKNNGLYYYFSIIAKK